MKTQIKKNGDTVVVFMDGQLDFETYVPLRESLDQLLDPKRPTPQKIIFNLGGLEFVGSSGISSFIQTLKEFTVNSPTRPRYCNVRSEFKQIIQAFDQDEIFEFFDTEDRARRSFSDH